MVDQLIFAYSRSVERHRGGWAAACALALAVAVVGGMQLDTRMDRTDFLPGAPDDESPLDSVILASVGATDRVVIYLDSADSLEASVVGPFIDDLASRIRSVDGVIRVDYRRSAEARSAADADLLARLPMHLAPHHLRMIGERISRPGIEQALKTDSAAVGRSDDPLGVVGLVAWTIHRVTGGIPIRTVDGYYAADDGRKFFVVADILAGDDDVQSSSRVVKAIDAAIDSARRDPKWTEVQSGFSLSTIGRPVSYAAASETLNNDIRRSGVAATIVIAILLVLFFRSVTVALALFAPIVFGIGVACIVGLVVFREVSSMALIFVGALVGLGVDFGIHIANHYLRLSDDPSREARVAYSVRRPGRALVFGGLTSVAAFIALGVMSYPVTRQVAVLAAVGLVAMLFATFVMLPVALSFVRLPENRDGAGLWNPRAAFFRSTAKERKSTRQRASIVWIALLLAVIPSMFSVSFEPHPWSLALRGNPKSAEMNRLNEDLGFAFSPLLLVSRGATREQAVERDRRAVALLNVGAQRAGIASIESISNWFPSAEQQAENAAILGSSGSTFSRERFVRDYDAATGRESVPGFTDAYRELVARYLDPVARPFELNDAHPNAQQYVFEKEGEYAAVSYVFLKRFPWAAGSSDRLQDTMRRLGFGELQGTTLLGESSSGEHARILTNDLFKSIAVVVLLVSLVLWFAFRNPAVGALCLVPAVCGLSAVVVAMAVLRLEMNMLTLSIVPLVVGIALDDGIHIADRLYVGQDLGCIFREAGSSMFMTTLTTIAAFSCMGLAEFGGVPELGLLGAIGLLVSFLAAIHLVPLLANPKSVVSIIAE